MTCKRVISWSTAYLEGELSVERANAVRGHLRTWDVFARAVSVEGVLRDELGRVDSELSPPKALFANIQKTLAKKEVEDASAFPGRLRWQWAASVLGLGAAAAAVVWLSGLASEMPQANLGTPQAKERSVEALPATGPSVDEQQKMEKAAAFQRYRGAVNEARTLAGLQPTVSSAPLGHDPRSLEEALRGQAAEREEYRVAQLALLAWEPRR